MKILMDSSIKKKLHQHFCQEFHWNLCTYSRTFDKIYKMLGFNYGIHDEQFYQQTSCRLKMSSKI
jgi:hypothetical protein